MQERRSPTKGASAGGCSLNSTIQKCTAQHAAVADGVGPRLPLKSTAVEAQRQRILAALRTGPKTSYDLRRLGCYQAPTRIIELRRMGYDIRTQLVTLYDRDGYMHPRCARYHLMGEVG
jgi:hypothetical protein